MHKNRFTTVQQFQQNEAKYMKLLSKKKPQLPQKAKRISLTRIKGDLLIYLMKDISTI